MKIDADRLNAVQEIAVDDIFKTVHIELPVLIVWLIQSHGQARAASSTLIQENPDGSDIFVPKIGRDLFGGRRGDFEHVILLDSFHRRRHLILQQREAKVSTT
jgi:hypothetical protein